MKIFSPIYVFLPKKSKSTQRSFPYLRVRECAIIVRLFLYRSIQAPTWPASSFVVAGRMEGEVVKMHREEREHEGEPVESLADKYVGRGELHELRIGQISIDNGGSIRVVPMIRPPP
ncbi:unnamed protein product [Cuscuta europaea]|uniref:Uncharacterized protein n=1 Tax=Cuscuta europaea TaxID=41803 RepID=A0A9P1E7S8_CUSEU|nr:unnamed protein product [Cuscuta europaea]